MDATETARARSAAFKFQAQMARSAYEARCEEIAIEVREKLIEPFCKRWGVSFNAGMGTWAFYAPASSPRGPGEPFCPTDYDGAQEDTSEEQAFASFGLPPEFWAEFEEVFDALVRLDSDAVCAEGLIRSYCARVSC